MSNITTKSINQPESTYTQQMRELRRRYRRKHQRNQRKCISLFVMFYVVSLFALLLISIKSNYLPESVPAMSTNVIYVHEEPLDEVELLLTQTDETLQYTEESETVDIVDISYDAEPVVSTKSVSDAKDSDTRYYIPALNLTGQEIQNIATLVFLESGTESYECQTAVASVIINRVVNTGATVHDVIYAKGQFSPAHRVSTTLPSDVSMAAIQDILANGTTVPQYVTYFRAGHYHNWGNRYKQYKHIDHTYFSYDSKLKEKLGQ